MYIKTGCIQALFSTPKHSAAYSLMKHNKDICGGLPLDLLCQTFIKTVTQ